MRTINITSARKELYSLVEAVNCDRVPVLITGKNGNAVLISEEDWNAIQETLYLNSISGMAESLIQGKESSLEDCLSEDEIE